MKIYEAENKQYILLGDLDHMLRCMRRKIYDKYTRERRTPSKPERLSM